MFSTQSIDEAAYLISRGFALRRARPPTPDEDQSLVTFLFRESEDLRQAVSDWENRYVEPVEGDIGRFADARYDLFRRVREVRG